MEQLNKLFGSPSRTTIDEAQTRRAYNTRSSAAVAEQQYVTMEDFRSFSQNLFSSFNTLSTNINNNINNVREEINNNINNVREDIGSLTQRIIVLEEKRSSKDTSRRTSKSSLKPLVLSPASPSSTSVKSEPSPSVQSVCSVEMSRSDEDSTPPSTPVIQMREAKEINLLSEDVVTADPSSFEVISNFAHLIQPSISHETLVNEALPRIDNITNLLTRSQQNFLVEMYHSECSQPKQLQALPEFIFISRMFVLLFLFNTNDELFLPDILGNLTYIPPWPPPVYCSGC